MKRLRFLVAMTAILCTILGTTQDAAAAKQHKVDLGLTVSQVACEPGVKNSYHYLATWRAEPPNTTYAMHSGNCKKLGPAVCDASGACRAEVGACFTRGYAGEWIQVTGNTDYGLQRISAVEPSKCQ